MPSNENLQTHFESINELKNYVGEFIGVSDWFMVTQERIDDFARVTLDDQWIHIDLKKAKEESPYGTTIAHGYLILSLIPKFLKETITYGDAKAGINYGSDKVRFTHPVQAGKKIRATFKLLEVLQIDHGLRYKMEAKIEIQGTDKPACIAELIALILH